MRILLDPGMYDLRNKGDVTLLQVATRRLTQLWPDACIEVLTSAPHLLRLYCPNAFPVSPDQLYDWTFKVGKVDRLLRNLPVTMLRIGLELRETTRHPVAAGGRSPRTAVPGRACEAGGSPMTPADASDPLEAHPTREEKQDQDADRRMLQGVDLYIATGSPCMPGSCPGNAMRALDRLETAAGLGITTAMVSQGLGPLDDAQLRPRARAVFVYIHHREPSVNTSSTRARSSLL